GAAREADGVWEGESLLYVLRERFGLYGSKNACEQGECGSCSVFLDGVLVCACLMLGGQANGRTIVTVEGLADASGLHPVLHAPDMLWGATVRSPHPYARIKAIDISAARAMPGVHVVLTHKDVTGRNLYGLEIKDQPVLAHDFVRYWGEAVALVAADHPEQARRAAQALKVDYEVLKPITDAEAALAPDAAKLHPNGNITRQVKIRHG